MPHFKAGGDGHDLAGGLHLGPQLPAGAVELVEGPLGELHHHVVHRRLKAGAGLAGDVVGDLVQVVAQSHLGGDFGDGVAGGLAGQGRGPGDPGFTSMTAYSKLSGFRANWQLQPPTIAQRRDDVQRRLAEHLILLNRPGSGAGATTMESPVWTPTGSKFSMLHTAMTLPAPSRMVSNSISFQPLIYRSTRIWVMATYPGPSGR